MALPGHFVEEHPAMKNPFSPSRWRFVREQGRLPHPRASANRTSARISSDDGRRRSEQVAAKPADGVRAIHPSPVSSVAQRLFRP